MKALAIACAVASCAICSALTQSWSVTGLNSNTRRVVPDGSGNVLLVSDNYTTMPRGPAPEIGWQKISPSGTVLASGNFASTPNKFEAVDAAVCGSYLGVIAYEGGTTTLAVLVFPLSGGETTCWTQTNSNGFARLHIRASGTAFYASACSFETAYVGKITTSGTVSWTNTSSPVLPYALTVGTDSSGNDWISLYGVDPTYQAGYESEETIGATGTLYAGAGGAGKPTYQDLTDTPIADGGNGNSGDGFGLQDAVWDPTDAMLFTTGSFAYEYPPNYTTGEYMPNVFAFSLSSITSPSPSEFENFPVENTQHTGAEGSRIAYQPSQSGAGPYTFCVASPTAGGAHPYDSFAVDWATDTLNYYQHTAHPTLVAADSTYAYFAGGGTLYEHVAATFALNASLTAAGSTDLLATAGKVFLVGTDTLVGFAP